MRKEQVDDIAERMPAQVATFDDAGIRTAITQLQNSGLLKDFLDTVRTDMGFAIQLLKLVWICDGPISAALSDTNKVTAAYVPTIKLLPANPTTEQVVGTFILFLKKLMH